jgi:hypothetical protein
MYHRSRVGGNTGPYTPGHDYLEEQVNNFVTNSGANSKKTLGKIYKLILNCNSIVL